MVQHSIITTILAVVFFPCAKSDVDANFGSCENYFYMNTTPINLGNADTIDICQRFNNQYYYATKYDVVRHIPWYSAYTLDSFGGNAQRTDEWRTNPEITQYMKQKQNTNDVDVNESKFQATNDDYVGSGYAKGHLNPAYYNKATQNKCLSTFTLTNAAPQVKRFNSKWYWKSEYKLYKLMEQYCEFEGAKRYFLTGVIPNSNATNSYICKKGNKSDVCNSDDKNKRVNIPSFFWTAACCDSSKADNQNKGTGWSIAVKGKNHKDTESVDTLSIDDMNGVLRQSMPGPLSKVALFQNNCFFNATMQDIIKNEFIIISTTKSPEKSKNGGKNTIKEEF